jgi:hypothetical protein
VSSSRHRLPIPHSAFVWHGNATQESSLFLLSRGDPSEPTSYFRFLGLASIFSLLRLMPAFLRGLGLAIIALLLPGVQNLFAEGVSIGVGFFATLAVSLGASRASPSGTVSARRFLAARSSSCCSASSSSEVTRWRFLLTMPWGRALNTVVVGAGMLEAGAGASFSLSGPVVLTAVVEEGKLPGIAKVGAAAPGAMDGRTWRTLAWPGEAPKPLGDTGPKLMVLSLRKVKLPGTEGAMAAVLGALAEEEGRP